MAKARKYRCPECTETFSYLHHPNEQDDPVRFCPKCGWSAAADEARAHTVEIEAPHVQNYAVVKGADNTYRAMEESSAHHVAMAAEMAGCDASEMASLKITDTKDNLQYGEIGVIAPQNSVTEIMAQAPATAGVGFGGAPQMAAQYAAAAHTGPDAFAGLRAASVLRDAHSKVGGGALSNSIVPLEIASRTQAPHLSRVPGGGRSARRRG